MLDFVNAKIKTYYSSSRIWDFSFLHINTWGGEGKVSCPSLKMSYNLPEGSFSFADAKIYCKAKLTGFFFANLFYPKLVSSQFPLFLTI